MVMSNRKLKRATPLLNEGKEKLVDAKKSRNRNHQQDKQLDFLQVCSKNGYEKKSNEIAVNLGFNMEVSNQGKK